MVLLITSLISGPEFRIILEHGTGEQVELVRSLGSAAIRVREEEYSMVVIDRDLAMVEPEAEVSLLHHCESAIPLYVNLSVSTPERVLAEIRSARKRREAERNSALRIASVGLKNELAGAVTGILLSSELAMSVPELPRAAQVKIKFVHDLAQGMRRQLEAI